MSYYQSAVILTHSSHLPHVFLSLFNIWQTRTTACSILLCVLRQNSLEIFHIANNSFIYIFHYNERLHIINVDEIQQEEE